TLRIRVDPADPNRWTARTTPAPLGPELVGCGIVFASGVPLCLIAAFIRSRVLRTLRTGNQIETVVLSARHSVAAPRAWQVRCSPTSEGDNRVFTVYVPPRADIANATLRLLIPAHGRPLAAEWFE